MKNFEFNEKTYELPDELVDYLNELEYYYEFKIGSRVIDVHFGIVGHIEAIYANFNNIPKEIINGSHDDFLKKLRSYLPIYPHLLSTYWIVMKTEKDESRYCLPYVYYHLMPMEDIEFEDEEPQADSITDV
jgi:hypothetical protein